jgi:LmbE family N-acetylglucosaminyl deacetylase
VSPDVVLTHPYEGGHPDHDACAFAVAAARRRLARIGEHVPDALELAYYHAAGGEPVFGRFITDARRPEHAVTLAPDVRATKAAMLACFASQAQVLALFPIDVERYREAGDYDFWAPPHAGAPYYERMGWAEFAGWSARVRRAANDLGLATGSEVSAIARDG